MIRKRGGARERSGRSSDTSNDDDHDNAYVESKFPTKRYYIH